MKLANGDRIWMTTRGGADRTGWQEWGSHPRECRCCGHLTIRINGFQDAKGYITTLEDLREGLAVLHDHTIAVEYDGLEVIWEPVKDGHLDRAGLWQVFCIYEQLECEGAFK